MTSLNIFIDKYFLSHRFFISHSSGGAENEKNQGTVDLI